MKKETIDRLRRYAPSWADLLMARPLCGDKIRKKIVSPEKCIVGECWGSGVYIQVIEEVGEHVCTECTVFSVRFFVLGIADRRNENDNFEQVLCRFLDHFEECHDFDFEEKKEKPKQRMKN